MTTPRIGSLCTGYGGLDTAVQAVYGGTLAWTSDIDPGASRIIAHHHPQVPNLGDLTTTQWDQVEPVDIVCGGYPCFIAGTMILTIEGYRPIESLAVGDLVLTHTGSWKPITSVMSRDDAPLWRVKAGNVITTTPEHPFYATRQDRKWNNTRRNYDRTVSQPEWVDARNLKAYNSRIGHVLPPVQEPDETDGAMWWLAGRYLADGYRQKRTRTGAGKPVKGDQGKVVIACGRGKEPELRAQLQRAGLHATESPERSVTKFVLSGPRMYQFVGDFGQGAHLKALPGRALALPPHLAEELLSGWLAGDGHREKSGWVGTTTSKELALGMVLLAHRARGVLASLNRQVPAPTKVIEGRTVNQRPWWRIRIPAKNRKGIVEGDRAWKFVTESEPVGLYGRVYNISVRDDESYLADGVIVHNCQPFSNAGLRKGTADERHIWPHIARALGVLRPRLAIFENVAGHLRRGFDTVLADLARLGFDAEWCTVRASEVGAPHRRERLFILAWPSDADGSGLERAGVRRAVAERPGVAADPAAANEGRMLGRGVSAEPAGRSEPGDGGCSAADAPDLGHERGRTARGRRTGPSDGGLTPADARRGGLAGHGELPPGRDALRQRVRDDADGRDQAPTDTPGDGRHERRTEPARQQGRPGAPGGGSPDWGSYGPAIRRWEAVTGRAAPWATDDRNRLSPLFVEWLMGLPAGHVTAVPGLSRNQQLKALGNGVVPQQAEAAIRLLHARATPAAQLIEAAA